MCLPIWDTMRRCHVHIHTSKYLCILLVGAFMYVCDMAAFMYVCDMPAFMYVCDITRRYYA